ncbi:phage integrase central domain-containing protein [Phyllobacterium bourgognense]|uniref:Phage integrase central domain-containing protein n=1 Tax=Phyllobacterium bourgognense TaxID=314236 RepID=A0A368YRC4_9HYPH|nr:hypothetical protein C7476_1097 [Phyllobacterium bourgognense]
MNFSPKSTRRQSPGDIDRWLLDQVRAALHTRPISEISSAEILVPLRKVEAKGNYETARRLRCTYGVSVNDTIRWRWFSPVDGKLHGEFLDAIRKFGGSIANWCLALRLYPDVYARSNSCGFCDICMLHVSRPARTALPSRCTKYKRFRTAYRPPSASTRRHLRTSVPRGHVGKRYWPELRV